MPDLIRHPEALQNTGFRLKFIPMKIGAGMTSPPLTIYETDFVALTLDNYLIFSPIQLR